jgi:hypothetical protein
MPAREGSPIPLTWWRLVVSRRSSWPGAGGWRVGGAYQHAWILDRLGTDSMYDRGGRRQKTLVCLTEHTIFVAFVALAPGPHPHAGT